MKKRILSTMMVVAMLIVAIAFPVSAKDISVKLNGNDIYFDVAPQIINDRTMVPMRAIFEALGYEVNWNSDEQTISAYNEHSENIILMTVGSVVMISGGLYDEYEDDNDFWDRSAIRLDSAPVIVNGRTLVPVRAISEASGCGVYWDDSNQTVYIETSGSSILMGEDDNNSSVMRVNSPEEAIELVRQTIENEGSGFASIIPYSERFKLDYSISTEFYFDDCYIVHAATTTINPGGIGSYKVYKDTGYVEYLGVYVSESIY